VQLDTDDALIRPVIDARASQQRLLCLTEQGRALVFAIDDLRQLKQGGRGVSLMDCDAKDPLTAIAAHTPLTVTIRGLARGSKAVQRELNMRDLAAYEARRGRKGKLLEPRIKSPSIVSIRGSAAGEIKDGTG